MDIALDSRGEVGVSGFAAVASGIFASRDAQAVVIAVGGAFDVFGAELGDFEGAEANVAAELEDEIVAVGGGGAPEAVEFGVGHPDVVVVGLVGGFESHVGYSHKLALYGFYSV